jgi:hypothetical protein
MSFNILDDQPPALFTFVERLGFAELLSTGFTPQI